MESILIIEDHPDLLKILSKQLTSAGFTVTGKTDGVSAFTWLDENRPDLIVLDVMLPDTDGFTICQQIRQRHSAKVLPILMLSALGDDSQARISGLKAGANDFMAKPYHFEELLLRVRTLLSLKAEIVNSTNLLDRYVLPVARQQAVAPTIKTHQEGRGVILFADLRGFTRMSAQTNAHNVITLLDEFFEVMMRIVREHGGLVFEIIGDGMMAVFNLPDPLPIPAQLATMAAQEMQLAFKKLKVEWRKAKLEVGLGIGIHQGEVILGDVGANELVRYTVIGSPVNIASRLVSMAQDGQIMVSAEVYEAIRLHESVQVQTISEVLLKGIETPQTLYLLA